jgi:MFS family permease
VSSLSPADPHSDGASLTDHAKRRVLWTTSASHGLIHVFELATPALLILIQAEFGAGDFTMGGVVSIYGLLFGLGALPAGAIADRVGAKPLLLACLWGAACSLTGMALSPSLALFALCAGCMGLFLSIYHPAGTSLITHSLPLSGRIFAIHGMAGNLGVAGASVIAGTLGALFGWRWALGILALCGFAAGLGVLSLPTPRQREVRSRAGRGNWPAFMLLLVAAAFMGMVYRGMTTFLPKFFATSYTDNPGAGVALGGLLTTVALLAGVGGMYLAGRAVDRGMHPAKVFLVGATVQIPFLIALAYMGGLVLVPLAMAVAFFHFFTQPPGNQMVAEFTPPRLRGLGYGIYFFVAFGTGSIGAGIGGWVSERAELKTIFPALAVVALPAVLAALALVARRGGETGARPSPPAHGKSRG